MPASVTMNGGISKKWMMAPIAAPNAAQSKSSSAKASSGGMPSRSIDSADEHRGEADHRADREVDAAGDDDEGHADRDDAEEGVVGEQIGDDAGRGEIGKLQRRRPQSRPRNTSAVIANRRQPRSWPSAFP